MELGLVGLGRMGANMARRLMADGHRCVVYDVNPDATSALAKEGAEGVSSLGELSEKLSAPVEMTADYAYFRLRDEGYQQADVERWARTIRELPGIGDAYVYFKHEEQGLGPEFAKRLIAAL